MLAHDGSCDSRDDARFSADACAPNEKFAGTPECLAAIGVRF
jgi:hypothetical protein